MWAPATSSSDSRVEIGRPRSMTWVTPRSRGLAVRSGRARKSARASPPSLRTSARRGTPGNATMALSLLVLRLFLVGRVVGEIEHRGDLVLPLAPVVPDDEDHEGGADDEQRQAVVGEEPQHLLDGLVEGFAQPAEQVEPGHRAGDVEGEEAADL